MSKNRAKKTNKTNPWLLAALVVLATLVVGLVIMGSGIIQAASPADTAALAKLPREVSVDDAYELREEGAFMLDVREPEEWEQVRMPGATLIPLGELETRLNEVPRDQPVVVVCRSGNRSATGRDILLQAGYLSVSSMAGGMNQWVGAGYPSTSGP